LGNVILKYIVTFAVAPEELIEFVCSTTISILFEEKLDNE